MQFVYGVFELSIQDHFTFHFIILLLHCLMIRNSAAFSDRMSENNVERSTRGYE